MSGARPSLPGAVWVGGGPFTGHACSACHYVIGRDWVSRHWLLHGSYTCDGCTCPRAVCRQWSRFSGPVATLQLLWIQPNIYTQYVPPPVMFSEDSRAVHPRLGWWSVIIIQGVTAPYFNSTPPSTHTHTPTHTCTQLTFLLSPYSLPYWLLSLENII